MGLGELLKDMSDTAEAASASEPCASSPAASASKGKEDHCAAHEASSEHAHGMPEAVSNPMLQMPKRQEPAGWSAILARGFCRAVSCHGCCGKMEVAAIACGSCKVGMVMVAD